jgi:homogentisate 1,2-dioxygenase
MPYYRCVGDIPRKRHMLHRHKGDVVFEEMLGEEGFRGAEALLYHRRSPSAIVQLDVEPETDPCWRPNHPVQPQHVRAGEVTAGGDPVRDRVALLGNDDIEIAYSRADHSSGLYRNGAGDELIYVQAGAAVLESVFGRLPVHQGDYVVIPAGTTHRWQIDAPVEFLMVSARGHVQIPPRYLNAHGQILEGSPFNERDVRGPDPEPLLEDGTEVPVIVRTRAGLSLHVHKTHPFDVVGWDGYVYPWAFNIDDFEPITGRFHQPPPVHQTFAGPNFAVCSFVPRPYDFDPDAVKVPYHHANVDTNEVLFYSRGNFMSRAGSGIGVASISLHPPGFVHGPQPGSREKSVDEARTEEVAVMIDVFAPLQLSDAARTAGDPDYPFSWSR